MKHSKVCPKCGAVDMIRIEGHAGAYGVGNNIPTGWSNFSSVPVTRYVCCRCGFSEEWIEGEKHLVRLKDKFGGQG